MTDLKSHYSCAELAAMKLPGFPYSTRGMRDRVKKDCWSSRQVDGKGGKDGLRTEYQPPARIMTLIREQTLQTLVSEAGEIEPIKKELTVAQTELAKPGNLKDWQREIAQARIAICFEVRRLAKAGGKERAIQTVIDLAARGELPERLQNQVPVANAKCGESRALSRTTLYRWLKETEGEGSGFARVAPKAREIAVVPEWASYLLSLYGQPQKPSLAHCVEQLAEVLPTHITPPSYPACRRFIEKMSNVDAQRGRMGSREIKNILPFVRRDTSDMWPTEVYTADGHTFDAEIAHPAHGQAFRPEITTVLDIATRKAVGWSAGLAESTWTVLDSLRHACTSCGIPSIFYVDNGSGFKNDLMNNETTGFMERLGIELTHSLPYGSQARGMIERVQHTIWVKSAKMLATYMGKDMDAQAKQKVFKITRKDIKAIGKSKLLIEWVDFLKFCQSQIDDYNNKPHRSLPKVRGEDGKKRHQTPNEAWMQAVSNGWQPVEVEESESEDLFRPYKTCKIIRAEIRLFGNLYFHPDLEDYHGETARVGYDIHDASRVWVRDRDGRLICIAEFEANKQRYFPEAFSEQANYKRAQGRIKRAEAKIEEAQVELDPPQLIEHQQDIELPPMMMANQAKPESMSVPVESKSETVVSIKPEPTQAQRPRFTTEIMKFRWLMNNKNDWGADDTRFLLKYIDGHQYFDMLEIYTFEGIGWTKDDDDKAKRFIEKEEPDDPEKLATQ